MFQRVSVRTAHADALHQLGQSSDARVLFEEAELILIGSEDHYPLLYSFQGYQYYNLLLAEGEADEVLRRSARW